MGRPCAFGECSATAGHIGQYGTYLHCRPMKSEAPQSIPLTSLTRPSPAPGMPIIWLSPLPHRDIEADVTTLDSFDLPDEVERLFPASRATDKPAESREKQLARYISNSAGCRTASAERRRRRLLGRPPRRERPSARREAPSSSSADACSPGSAAVLADLGDPARVRDHVTYAGSGAFGRIG